MIFGDGTHALVTAHVIWICSQDWEQPNWIGWLIKEFLAVGKICVLTSTHLTFVYRALHCKLCGLILSDRKIPPFLEPLICWTRYVHEVNSQFLSNKSQWEMVFKNEYYPSEGTESRKRSESRVGKEGMIAGKCILSWNFKCTTTQSWEYFIKK